MEHLRKFNEDLEKHGGQWNYVHDSIIDRISELHIDCPECECIDDDQYSCGTCGGQGSSGKIHILSWIKDQTK